MKNIVWLTGDTADIKSRTPNWQDTNADLSSFNKQNWWVSLCYLKYLDKSNIKLLKILINWPFFFSQYTNNIIS